MLKVLIIEDEKLIRDGTTSIIKNKASNIGEIHTATDGIEGMEIALKVKPDILITDIKMPQMNGIDVIKSLHEKLPAAYFIIVSGYSDFQYAQAVIKYKRVKEYLLKPINWATLVNTIDEIRNEIDKKGNEAKFFGSDSLQNSPNPGKSNEVRKIIEKAKKYIYENYNKDITLNVVGEYLYLNPSYFSLLFKTQTGEGFLDYLTKVRINNAKRLLNETGIKVYLIAEMVGYKSEKHFISTFRKLVGCSPNKYRDLN